MANDKSHSFSLPRDQTESEDWHPVSDHPGLLLTVVVNSVLSTMTVFTALRIDPPSLVSRRKYSLAGILINSSISAEDKLNDETSFFSAASAVPTDSRRFFHIQRQSHRGVPLAFPFNAKDIYFDEEADTFTFGNPSGYVSRLDTHSNETYLFVGLCWKSTIYQIVIGHPLMLRVIENGRMRETRTLDLWDNIASAHYQHMHTMRQRRTDISIDGWRPNQFLIADVDRTSLSSKYQMMGNDRFIVMFLQNFLYILSFDPDLKMGPDHIRFPNLG